MGSGSLDTPPALCVFVEKIRELAGDGPAQLFDIGDGHRPFIIAGDIMADADCQQFHR